MVSAMAENPAPIHEGERCRILFVDHSGLPGGGQLGLRRYSSHHSRNSNSFLFLSGGPVVESMVSFGLNVRIVDGGSAELSELVGMRRRLRELVDDGGYDLVVANSFRSAVALALAKPRAAMAYYARQDMSFGATGVLPGLAARLGVYPRFESIIVNSSWTASTVPLALRSRIAASVAYPVCGVEGSAKSNRVLPNGVLEVLWIGRIVPWKGLETLIDAVSVLIRRDLAVHVSVAGDAIHGQQSYFERIRRKVADAGLPIDFLGYVSDVGSLLEGGDVLVHSSVKPEPFGQVIVQGLASGVPVVASNSGGPAEIIRDGQDGLLFRPGDSLDLARQLERIARDSALYRRLSAAGIIRSVDFHDEAAVRRLDDAVVDAVVRRQRPRRSMG